MEATVSYLLMLQKFKANDSEMEPTKLILGNISNDFTRYNMKKQD